MESNFFIALFSAFWFGILTSISPCPLATNIAAISYIGKETENIKKSFLMGAFYSLGRTFVYLFLAFIFLYGALNIPFLANFLQKNMNKILGPIFIIVAMFLFEMFSFSFNLFSGSYDKLQKRVSSKGIFGAFLLGVLFALSFCPVSAALFFGSLLPLAAKFSSAFFMPIVYGVGTALPVILFGIVIAFFNTRVGTAFNKVKKIEFWAQRITAIIFLALGFYFSIKYIYMT